MSELYVAELRRFARWAAGLAVLHILALLMLDYLFPGISDDDEICNLAATVYAACGAVFGVYQAASYARLNHWIALLHRPVAPWRIMAGVVGAGATTVVGVMLPPLLLLIASQTLGVDRVVDARHWLMPSAATLFALIGFLGGSYAAVAPRRYGWTGLAAAAVLMIGNLAYGAAALLLPALTVVLLALLTAGAFRPDRTRAATQPVLLGLSALAAAFTIFFMLLMGGGLVYHLSLAALGRNALVNAGAATPGGLVQSSRANSDELIASALGRAAPDLRGVEVVRLPNSFDWLPRRGEMTRSVASQLTDTRRGIAYTYSHDANPYVGLRLKDRRPVGELRPDGDFPAPPISVGDDMVSSGGALYRLDPATGRIVRLLQLPAGETIVARPRPVGRQVAVLGDRALYLYDRSVMTGQATIAPAAIPLGGAVGDIRRIDAAPLPDRTIVSIFFGQNSIEGPLPASQRVVSVAPDGRITPLAARSFAPEFDDTMRFRATWISPVIYTLAEGAERIGAVEAANERQADVVVPSGVWVRAALLALVAAIGTAILARRRRLSAMATGLWSLASLIFSLPMVLAFALIERRRPVDY
ncbi:hypothetical protein ACFSC3_01335 [Sphingomonas floccifaciens]|uniref:ABC transporter permease n=1 Tax=Sphingomonas floccifaciens TaxID=1844115 RepID=A0ABW4NA65_9SPHN